MTERSVTHHAVEICLERLLYLQAPPLRPKVEKYVLHQILGDPKVVDEVERESAQIFAVGAEDPLKRLTISVPDLISWYVTVSPV
jgi:hypothetical protein